MNYNTYFINVLNSRPYSHTDDFAFLQGNLPVIFSAPHNVEQVRDGMFKYAEPGTGVLAHFLYETTGSSAIIKTSNNSDDANYDENSPYKQFLIEHINNNNYTFLIDLHQMSPQREQDVIIGSGKGQNIQGYDTLADDMAELLINEGLSNIVVDEIFPALGPNRVTTTIHENTALPSIQLEMNTKYLDPKNSSFNPEPIMRALETVATYA